MARRPSPSKTMAVKQNYLASVLIGRSDASSSMLAASCGLPIDQVQKAMKAQGVRDNDQCI